MVAPLRNQRDVAAPLSRLRHSNNWFVRFAIIFGLVVGAALVLKSRQSSTHSKTQAKETLVLITKHGAIRIVMRPDLSKESVDYIRELAEATSCPDCNLYRAEPNFLLQGIMKHPNTNVKVTKGECPPGYETKSDDCPPNQFACGCHGPTMTKGFVGWAAGETGPDFFIDTNKDPVTDWGQTHTVFGQVQDEASFAVIDKIYSLPTTKKGLTMLVEKIEFTLSIE